MLGFVLVTRNTSRTNILLAWSNVIAIAPLGAHWLMVALCSSSSHESILSLSRLPPKCILIFNSAPLIAALVVAALVCVQARAGQSST